MKSGSQFHSIQQNAGKSGAGSSKMVGKTSKMLRKVKPSSIQSSKLVVKVEPSSIKPCAQFHQNADKSGAQFHSIQQNAGKSGARFHLPQQNAGKCGAQFHAWKKWSPVPVKCWESGAQFQQNGATINQCTAYCR